MFSFIIFHSTFILSLNSVLGIQSRFDSLSTPFSLSLFRLIIYLQSKFMYQSQALPTNLQSIPIFNCLCYLRSNFKHIFSRYQIWKCQRERKKAKKVIFIFKSIFNVIFIFFGILFSVGFFFIIFISIQRNDCIWVHDSYDTKFTVRWVICKFYREFHHFHYRLYLFSERMTHRQHDYKIIFVILNLCKFTFSNL